MLKRRGSAVWNGTGLEGSGRLNTFSGALKDQPYSTAMRFQSEDGRAGTNPEELIAAAHAACFSMALSGNLAKAGHTADSVKTEAEITLDKVDGKPTVTRIHLVTKGKVPGLDADGFKEQAEAAKDGCPISRLLAGGSAEITLDATLDEG
jgi:lipoyl-dependent peroxiredoxin